MLILWLKVLLVSLANFLLSLSCGHYSAQVGLLNVDGYYNSLLALFDNGVVEGFIKPVAREIVISAPTAKELMEKMEVSGTLPSQCLCRRTE